MILTISPGEAFSSSVAVAPKRNGKIARPPSPNVKASGGEPDEDVVGRDVEDFPGIAVGDDQEIAMEMHRRLGFARRARGKAEQRDIVAAGLDRIEPHRLVQRHPVEFGVVV